MIRVSRKVDQPVLIGRGLVVMPTDIDEDGVRLIARGEIVGGPQDGQRIASVHELGRGHSLHLGPHVVVMLIDVDGDAAVLGVMAPKHMEISTPTETKPDRPAQGQEFED